MWLGGLVVRALNLRSDWDISTEICRLREYRMSELRMLSKMTSCEKMPVGASLTNLQIAVNWPQYERYLNQNWYVDRYCLARNTSEVRYDCRQNSRWWQTAVLKLVLSDNFMNLDSYCHLQTRWKEGKCLCEMFKLINIYSLYAKKETSDIICRLFTGFSH